MDDICRAYVNSTRRFLKEQHDLTLFGSGDMAGWVQAHQRALDRQGWKNINPAFDPDIAGLNRGNAYWLGLMDRGGEVIAWIAGRAIKTNDLDAYIKSGQLWSHEKDMGWCMAERPRLYGVCWNQGGLDVEPEYRERRLGGLLARLIRAYGLQEFKADHVFGIQERHLGESDISKYYGWEYKRLAFEEWDVLGEPQHLYVTGSSRDFALNELWSKTLPHAA